jgi:hypothetical protein
LCVAAGLSASVLLNIRAARAGVGSFGFLFCATTILLGVLMLDFWIRMFRDLTPVRSGSLETMSCLALGVTLVGLACFFLGWIPLPTIPGESTRPVPTTFGTGLLVGGLLQMWFVALAVYKTLALGQPNDRLHGTKGS